MRSKQNPESRIQKERRTGREAGNAPNKGG